MIVFDVLELKRGYLPSEIPHESVDRVASQKLDLGVKALQKGVLP